MTVLSLDPSLRAFGWAIIQDNEFIDGGCIVTKKLDKSFKVSDSDTASLISIATSLKEVLTKYSCDAILFEAPIGSKSGRANQALSFVKGLVIAISVFSNIPPLAFRAKSVKKALTGDLNATKEDILQKVSEKMPSFSKKTSHLPKFKVYAISDAVAVYIASECK